MSSSNDKSRSAEDDSSSSDESRRPRADDPRRSSGTRDSSRRRTQWGWIVTALGFIVLLWGVFHLTSATVGGPVHGFSERRTYNEVKEAAQETFPGALMRGLLGLALMWLGGWIRNREPKSS